MNFHFMPSLEYITVVKIVTTLWTRDDIKALMANYFHEMFNDREEKMWQKIENKVIEIEFPASYPEVLKGEIRGCIKPVGLQILNWMFHDLMFLAEGHVAPYLNTFAWTPYGTLDKRKTAELLIKNEIVDISSCYKLACFYCLEDDIPKLWSKIPEDGRKKFYDEENFGSVSQHIIVFFWTCHIKEKLDDLYEIFGRDQDRSTPFQFVFEYAANWGNKPASEYYLQKLTPGEKQKSVTECVEDLAGVSHEFARRSSKFHVENYGSDVLCFLLSQMVEEERITLLQRRPHRILEYFLDWPLQSLFMEIASYMWDSLSENNYYVLLDVIVDKVINGAKDFDYQNLFQDFWKRSPSAHKRYVIDECTRKSLLLKLLRIKAKNTIRLILRHATNIERRNLIFCDRGQDLCQGLIVDNECDLLEYFVKESVQSEDEIIRLKYTFQEHIRQSYSREETTNNDEKWNKFVKLLNDLMSARGKSAETSDNTA